MLPLDVNISPFNAPYNRFPDGSHAALRAALSAARGIRPEAIGIGAGTELITDALMRTFCTVGKDSIIVASPTRSIYARRAAVCMLDCRHVALQSNFSLSAENILNAVSPTTRMIFLCSPGSPTGVPLDNNEIRLLLDLFEGIVVVDESYIDFARTESMVKDVAAYPNLVVMQSFSRAWSMAAWRVAAVYAVPEVQAALRCVMPEHTVSTAAEEAVTKLVERRFDVDKWVNRVAEERIKVMTAIHSLPVCIEVLPSLCNFFLVRFKQCDHLHRFLLQHRLRLKNCSKLPLCEHCLRITVGLPGENNRLLGLLRRYCEEHTFTD